MIEIVPTEDITKYSATVSQEYLEIVLPNYVGNIANRAQVDPNYIVVKQYYGENGTSTDYINHPYEVKNGINLQENSDYVTKNADGSISVWLDTKLRTNGVIDTKNLNKPLKYTIEVRYKLNNYDLPYTDADDESGYNKYANCYVYYNNNKAIYYHTSVYTISIDRQAPS